MAMDRLYIIAAIAACSARTGLAPSTITGRAVNNSRLYQRMVDGGDCTTEIGKKLIAFMDGLQEAKQNGAA